MAISQRRNIGNCLQKIIAVNIEECEKFLRFKNTKEKEKIHQKKERI
jgi:hypothetical protein